MRLGHSVIRVDATSNPKSMHIACCALIDVLLACSRKSLVNAEAPLQVDEIRRAQIE